MCLFQVSIWPNIPEMIRVFAFFRVGVSTPCFTQPQAQMYDNLEIKLVSFVPRKKPNKSWAKCVGNFRPINLEIVQWNLIFMYKVSNWWIFKCFKVDRITLWKNFCLTLRKFRCTSKNPYYIYLMGNWNFSKINRWRQTWENPWKHFDL